MRHIEGPPMTQRQVREPCIEPSNAPEKKSVSQTAAYHPDNRGGGGLPKYPTSLHILSLDARTWDPRPDPEILPSILRKHRCIFASKKGSRSENRGDNTETCMHRTVRSFLAAFSEKAQRFSEKASVCGDLMGKLFLQWLIYKDSKYLTIYFFLRKRSEHLNSPPPRHC